MRREATIGLFSFEYLQDRCRTLELSGCPRIASKLCRSKHDKALSIGQSARMTCCASLRLQSTYYCNFSTTCCKAIMCSGLNLNSKAPNFISNDLPLANFSSSCNERFV